MSAAHEDPYKKPDEYVWRQEGKQCSKVAVRKLANWKTDPLWDEDKFFAEYRQARILESQWVGV